MPINCKTELSVRFLMNVIIWLTVTANSHSSRLILLCLSLRGMLHPHYTGAWDSVVWSREARMTLRNAIVVFSIPFSKRTMLYQTDGPV